jgi:transcription initiation factor TFIIIB Brf1 subunit/transcription initiation factor TFIIB
MKCIECQTNEFEYDEVMGETACKVCGLIVATEMFEETVRAVSNSVETHTKERIGLGSVIISGKLKKTHNR